MFIDSATLSDLEVVSTSTSRGPTLWGLVDRTRSRIGREHLRRRLLSPSHSAEEIPQIQQAHQLLAADAGAYRKAIDRAVCDEVEDYLSSTWHLPNAMPGLAPLAGGLFTRDKWYQRYLKDVGKGQASVLALLDAAADLGGRFLAGHSAVLRDVGQRIEALLNTPNAERLRRFGGSHSRTAKLAFDQLARESAKGLLVDVIDCVGAVEAMWSLAAATSEHGWCYPQPSATLRAVGLFHPFLGRQSVPNDLQLDGQVRVCFLTGPNMAGKSTFLKAIAIAVLLAHAGCGVPARSLDFPTVGTIFSSVQIVDNLSGGESFYLAEVRRIRALAVALHDHVSAIAIVDEPFRGTNVHDAAEATLAVITRLAAHPSALVFVASHIGEVVPAIANDPRIGLFHFSADITTDIPRFDFRLREGVSDQRLGMLLLRQEQVLDLLERPAGPPSPSRS
jgi:DNA mismatch repair protein MutS